MCLILASVSYFKWWNIERECSWLCFRGRKPSCEPRKRQRGRDRRESCCTSRRSRRDCRGRRYQRCNICFMNHRLWLQVFIPPEGLDLHQTLSFSPHNNWQMLYNQSPLLDLRSHWFCLFSDLCSVCFHRELRKSWREHARVKWSLCPLLRVNIYYIILL